MKFHFIKEIKGGNLNKYVQFAFYGLFMQKCWWHFALKSLILINFWNLIVLVLVNANLEKEGGLVRKSDAGQIFD